MPSPPRVTRSARVNVIVLRRSRLLLLTSVAIVAVPLAAMITLRVTSHDAFSARESLQDSWLRLGGLSLQLLPAVVAGTLASQQQRGLRRQRLLDGESIPRQFLSTALLFGSAYLVAAVAVMSLISGLSAVDAAWHGSPDFATSWPNELSIVFSGTLLVCMVGLAVGVVIGAVCQRTVSAVTATAVLAVGTLALRIVLATNPELGWAYVAMPSGILILTGADSLPTLHNGQVQLSGVAAIAWPVAAVLAVYWRVRAQRLDTIKYPRGRMGIAVLLGWGVPLLLVLGFVTPTALRDQIPWPYRPSWLQDKAHHRTSLDIAGRFLADVRQGDWVAADALTTTGNARTLLGPYRSRVLEKPAPTVSIDDRPAGDPGQVDVGLRLGEFSLCMARIQARWLITELRTGGGCPSAVSR
jgi:hypothetical protein